MNVRSLLPPAVLLVATTLPLGGCISFDLGAKDIVDDTVSAGKGLYRTLRHRRDGTEDRRYTHTAPITERQTDTEAAVGCLAYLRGLADAVTESSARVLAESTEILDVEGERSMRCTLDAVVPSA